LTKVALVTPMAGRGSRFARDGAHLPKPLMQLWGRPFFWWATESARRAFDVVEMVFVVLQDHVRDFAIDRHIRDHYPNARLVVSETLTRGAAETAKLAVEQLEGDWPLLVNDSDHAFAVSGAISDQLSDVDGALLTFESDDPAYSYVRFDEDGAIIGTVEKRAVSREAIAGAYLFAGPETFLDVYRGYERDCPYDEVFLSGLYNRLIDRGARVAHQRLQHHLSFGTPAEVARLDHARAPWREWL
jgi:NDP-sugar pyrophosphorylase family protein